MIQTATTLQDLLALKASRPAPLQIVHCGSTDKAKDAFEQYRLEDTLALMIVLTIGANAKDRDLNISDDMKTQLDILHLHKIDKADVVRILNVKDYIGTSTRRELEYARMLHKPILWIESHENVQSCEHDGCTTLQEDIRQCHCCEKRTCFFDGFQVEQYWLCWQCAK